MDEFSLLVADFFLGGLPGEGWFDGLRKGSGCRAASFIIPRERLTIDPVFVQIAICKPQAASSATEGESGGIFLGHPAPPLRADAAAATWLIVGKE